MVTKKELKMLAKLEQLFKNNNGFLTIDNKVFKLYLVGHYTLGVTGKRFSTYTIGTDFKIINGKKVYFYVMHVISTCKKRYEFVLSYNKIKMI